MPVRHRAFSIVLRLPWEVNPLFQDWLDRHFPDRAARVMARVREMRGGKDYDAQLRHAHDGRGRLGAVAAPALPEGGARLGLNRERLELDLTRFVRPRLPARAGQGELF